MSNEDVEKLGHHFAISFSRSLCGFVPTYLFVSVLSVRSIRGWLGQYNGTYTVNDGPPVDFPPRDGVYYSLEN